MAPVSAFLGVIVGDHGQDKRFSWPALHEAVIDGWLVRFAKGLTRRANSANPLRGERSCSDALISRLEGEYRQQTLPVYFRIPSIIGPAMPDRLRTLE